MSQPRIFACGHEQGAGAGGGKERQRVRYVVKMRSLIIEVRFVVKISRCLTHLVYVTPGLQPARGCNNRTRLKLLKVQLGA